MKAANSSGNTAIAVRGKNSAAFIAQKKVPVRSFVLARKCVFQLLIKKYNL
jgi:20S proteasome alpha/beta subunit